MEIAPTTLIILSLTLFALGVGSGVFGLGVGIVAAPVLSFFLRAQFPDIAALTLVLNAFTCAMVVAVLAPVRLVAWKHALGLGLIAAIFAPVAIWADRAVPFFVTWYVYLGAVLFLVMHLLRPPRGHELAHVNWKVLYTGSPLAALVGGFTGIGPGFAYAPGLVVAGMDVRHAAGTAAAASIFPSLTALIPLRGQLGFTAAPATLLIPLAAAVIGSAVGAMYSARKNISLHWQRVFAGFVAVLALVHFCTLGARFLG